MNLQKEVTYNNLKQQEAWKNYYNDTFVRPFGNQIDFYEASLREREIHLPALLDPSKPKNFVLAGFHPSNNTPEDFKEFCQKMHNNPNDRHIYLDMNLLPLNLMSREHQKYRIQALLEKLPFSNNSIDFLLADYTTDFMDDEQVIEFSKSAKQAITKDGLVIIANMYPRTLKSARYSHPQLTFYPRYVQQIQRLLSDLKFVGFSYGSDSSVLTFARKASVFPSAKHNKKQMEGVYPYSD